jgi:hypothetical protein
MNQAAPGTMSGTAGHEPQGQPAKVGFGGKVQCRTVALDFGGTISLDRIDHVIGQKPVDRQRQRRCASFTTAWGCTSFWRLNNQPHESRWPALQQAEIDHLFTAAVLSYPLGVRKPSPVFYEIVLAAAGRPAGQALFVGDHLKNDAVAPARHGMRTALVCPRGLRPGEVLPDGTLLITHVRELPLLLETA